MQTPAGTRPIRQTSGAPRSRTSDDLADWYDARLRLHGSRGDLFVARRGAVSPPTRPDIRPIPFGRANRDSAIIPALGQTADD